MNRLLSVKNIGFFMPAVIASVALGGCTQEMGSAEEGAAEIQDDLYRTGTTWKNSIVNVCIDPTDNGGARKALLVAETKRVLAATWGKASALQFKGSSTSGAGQAEWGTCDYSFNQNGNYSTIALHFCSKTSTSAFCTENKPAFWDNGTMTVGGYRGRTENYTTYHFGPVPPTMFTEQYNVTYKPGVEVVGLVGDIDDTVDRFQTRFRYQVIHEFGHALGFRHEQDRPENADKSLCSKSVNTDNTGAGYGLDGYETVNDNNSIMSYCSEDTLDSVNKGFPVLLSGTDIRGARIVYGNRPSAHGFMILSDADPSFAIAAANGAHEHGGLVMTRGCTINDPDCTWTFHRGMLLSDRNPTLAIKRVLNSSGKYSLTLETAALKDNPGFFPTFTCTPADPTCTWTYRRGQFLLDADSQTYAMNAHGGTFEGAEVVATTACTGTNTSCLWTLPNVMLTADRDSTLPVNSYGGAANGGALKVNQACDIANGDCTFTFHRGLIQPTSNPAAALKAIVPTDGTQVGVIQLNTGCREGVNNCTWEWGHGTIQTDEHYQGRFYMNALNGATNLADVKLHKACTRTNPDCVFSGFSARN